MRNPILALSPNQQSWLSIVGMVAVLAFSTFIVLFMH
jgi:hypothetical protein